MAPSLNLSGDRSLIQKWKLQYFARIHAKGRIAYDIIDYTTYFLYRWYELPLNFRPSCSVISIISDIDFLETPKTIDCLFKSKELITYTDYNLRKAY
jgi:hypothetical protein